MAGVNRMGGSGLAVDELHLQGHRCTVAECGKEAVRTSAPCGNLGTLAFSELFRIF